MDKASAWMKWILSLVRATWASLVLTVKQILTTAWKQTAVDMVGVLME